MSVVSQDYEFGNSTFDSEISTYNYINQKNLPPVHQLHFTDKSDILVKISRAIFDDFKAKLPIIVDDFRGALESFSETCRYAVQSIEKLFEQQMKMDYNSKLIFNQLSLEHNAYDLMLRLLNSEDAVSEIMNNDSESYLTKLFSTDIEFRRLLTLLQWSEEIAFNNPGGFSIFTNEVKQFDSINNIYAVSAMRGNSIHMDSRYDGSVEREDEEKHFLLQQVVFSLLRCGRITEVKRLLNNVGLNAINAFIFIREFLTNSTFTPTDPLHDNYNLAKSRVFCKQTARDLITIDDTVSSADQCIWATLSSSLPTLLSHASTTEDRIWAYVSCAADYILDEYLLNAHSKGSNELENEVLLAKNDLLLEDIPKTVNEIFSNIRINESNVYYLLFGYLAVSDWEGAINYILHYLNSLKKNSQIEIPAHELRFLTHLTLLLKLTNRVNDHEVCDILVEKYSDLLIQMKHYTIVPNYLTYLSTQKSISKMLDFLQIVENVAEQQEILLIAAECNFNTLELCKKVYYRFKEKHKICTENDEIGQATIKILQAWRWLNHEKGLIFEAIAEANYLLRKLLLHNRIAEALEFLKITNEDLASRVEDYCLFEGIVEKPLKIVEAQHEFESYLLYFEAMNRFNMWQKHVEGSAPELPKKPSDEYWARLDMKRRTEYELSLQKAKDCLQKYIKLGDILKQKAIELLEGVLCRENGWLAAGKNDEDSSNLEICERATDFIKICNEVFYHICQCLIELYTKSDSPVKILKLAVLLVDPRYNIHKSISKIYLQKLLSKISRLGGALLNDDEFDNEIIKELSI